MLLKRVISISPSDETEDQSLETTKLVLEVVVSGGTREKNKGRPR
jgi:hypothetical protein